MNKLFKGKKYFSILENLVSYSLFKFIDAIIPFIIIPYLLVVVGADNYGVYAFAYALTLYLINVIQYGFLLSGVRLIAINRDNKSKLNSLYSQVFSTQIVLTLVVLLVLFLLVLAIPIFREQYIIYLFFSIMLVGELFTPIWLFLGLEKMRFITFVNLASKLTFALLVFLLIKAEADYTYIALYEALGYILSGVTAQYIIIKVIGIKFTFVGIAAVINMLKHSFSSFLTLITPMLYTNSSIFLVGLFGIPAFVSFMQIGTKVSGAFSVLNTILTSVFYPVINRNKNLFKIVQYIFIISGLVLSAIMFFFSDFLIDLWIPKENDEITRVVKFLSPVPFLSSVISTFGVNGLMVNNKDKVYMTIVLIGSVVGLVTALILIPEYFYIGGAISIVTALSIKSILTFIYNKRTTQLKPRKVSDEF